MNRYPSPVIALRTRTRYAVLAFIMLTSLTAYYMYLRLSANDLYTQHYHPYHLHLARGESDKSLIKEAYGSGKLDSVISRANSIKDLEPEEYLLTGIAYLEKNQAAKAIETFQMLIEKNKKTNTDFFEDDAEYYLAMSYLNNHETQKAIPIFEKIQSDPDHKYNSDVSEWFVQNTKAYLAKQ
jgi:tetratricopeptide (TPR) repeat protein